MRYKEHFVQLHAHSDHSSLDGCAKVSDYVKEAAKRGAPALGLTEHGTLRSYFDLHCECEKHGIKPIYGIEFYVSNDMFRKGVTDLEREYVTSGLGKKEHKKAIKEFEEKEGVRSRWHLTAWARNDIGLKNLFKLSTMSNIHGFYFKPRIDLRVLKDNSEGISIGTGCVSSVLHYKVNAGQMKTAFRIADELREVFVENMWLEIQPHDIGIQTAANQFNLELKKRWGDNARLLATQDAHYVRQSNAASHEVMLCVGTGSLMSDPNRFRFNADQYWFKTRKEMFRAFRENHSYISKEQVKEALDNTVVFSEQVNATVKVDYQAAILPKAPIPKGVDSEWKYIKNLCSDGWKWRKVNERIVNLSNSRGSSIAEVKKEYKERLKFELKVLYEKRFVSYFLIVHDLYVWARSQGIMTSPGRGSSAGSLVSFLLGLTSIDPIEHGLFFERFINPGRNSLPDFDADFGEDKRQEILEYLRMRYGNANVAQITTVNKLSGRQCLKDVARVLGVPFSRVNEVTGSLIEVEKRGDESIGMLENAFNEVGACKDLAEEYPDVPKHAIALEGMSKSLGIHAAGVVITPEEVWRYVPLEIRKHKGRDVVVTALDMRGVEAVGLVKLDILGLKTLTIFKNCVDAIEKNKGQKINLEEVDLNDKAVLDLFTKHDFSGVFQFDTHSMAKVAIGVKFESFDDITALNALNRPGTTRSGLADEYVKRRNDPELAKKDLFHPKVSEITKDTFGVMVYQEHIIRIFMDVAGYTAGEADLLRKAIGKSKGDEAINKERAHFIQGAKERGLTESEATKIMNAVVKFGGYAFNRAHAASYAMLAYWAQWLKHYYPLEFYWALLKSEDDTEKIKSIAKDAKRKGIKILPPDINKSEGSFAIDNERGVVLASLLDIKGVGETAVKTIVENKPYTGFIDFLQRINRAKCNKNVILSLARSGALDSLLPNVKWFIENSDSYLTQVRKEGFKSRSIRLELLKSARKEAYTKEQRQKVALSVSPLSFDKHPLDVYRPFIREDIKVKISPMKGEFFKRNDDKCVYVIGVLQKKKLGRIGDFHSGDLPSEEKKKKMFWGAQTAALHLEGVGAGSIRVKFDRHVFDDLFSVIDLKEGAPILALVSVNDQYKSARVSYAIDLEGYSQKIEKGERLNLFEKLVKGEHPALEWNWKSEKEKERFTTPIELKKQIKVCGVITDVKTSYDRSGREMAIFGLSCVGIHLEVLVFSMAYEKVKDAINKAHKEQRLIVVDLDRMKNSKNTYCFQKGTLKVLKKSS